MTRMNVSLITAGVVLLGVLALGGSFPATPQSQSPARSTLRPTEAENGRYQIFNGTPDMARNIMLLDTQTGKTWIVCSGDDGEAWCAMNTGVQAGRAATQEVLPSPKQNLSPSPISGPERELTMKSLLGQPSGASDGATNVTNGVKLVSRDGKWQLP